MRNTPFWQQFRKDPVTAELAAETLEFVERSKVRASSTGLTGVQTALLKLASTVNNLGIDSSPLACEAAYEFKKRFLEKRPVFTIVTESTMTNWMEQRVPQALAVFRSMLVGELAQFHVAADADEDEEESESPALS